MIGCGKKAEYKSFPKQWLDIQTDDQGKTYIDSGFKQGHRRKEQLGTYETLTIPKEVTYLKNGCFVPDENTDYSAPLAIKTIDFKKGCQCTMFSTLTQVGTNFNNCVNLETVIFPPLYTAQDQFMFVGCPKLSTFDLRNITKNVTAANNYLNEIKDFPENGQIIIKKHQTNVATFAEYLRTKLENKGWKIVTK